MQTASRRADDAPYDPASIGEMLSNAYGSTWLVSSITRRASEFATPYRAEVLNVAALDGRHTMIFVKEAARQLPDHPDKSAADRELLTYSQVLAPHRLPVPVYLGGSTDEATGRTTLFLEYVDDWNLRYHDLGYWYSAAARLGDLHRAFVDDPARLDGAGFLPLFDVDWHREWAERALASLTDVSRELAARLAVVVSGYDAVADVLLEQPRTLVHNDLAPKNVIADRRQQPARICFVDWEMAGLGCGLLDLAQLTYGLGPSAVERMHEAYFRSIAGSPLAPRDSRSRDRLLAACELQRSMTRLWRNHVWQKPIGVVAGWVSEAVDSWTRVARS